MTTYHQLVPSEDTVNKNPVLVILNGLAACVSAVLLALNAVGVTHLAGAAVAAVVFAVAVVCNTIGLAVRASVTPVAVADQRVAEALATPVPAVGPVPPGQNVVIAGPALDQGFGAAVQNPKDGR